jgi:hypothetical protein
MKMEKFSLASRERGGKLEEKQKMKRREGVGQGEMQEV